MNKHELFDLIGEADENYVNAADAPARRARPRWQTWVACAACAALVVGAYPAYRALAPGRTPLHSYTVVEGSGGYLTEHAGIIKAPHQGGGAENAPGFDIPIPEPSDPGGGDVSVEEGPYAQYNSLFENARLDRYPEWYGGAFNDYEDGVPVKLVVCIVDGFHTPELEAQITDWCGGGEIAFKDVKYSRGYLQELMERLNGSEFLAVTKEDPAVCGCGVYEDENCIRMDCRDTPGDAVLMALAELDPDGDAIQVRVFTGVSVNPDIVKGPAPGGSVGSVATPVPGGAQPANDPIEPTEEPIAIEPEQGQPARYDAYGAIPGGAKEQDAAHYDLLPLDE